MAKEHATHAAADIPDDLQPPPHKEPHAPKELHPRAAAGAIDTPGPQNDFVSRADDHASINVTVPKGEDWARSDVVLRLPDGWHKCDKDKPCPPEATRAGIVSRCAAPDAPGSQGVAEVMTAGRIWSKRVAAFKPAEKLLTAGGIHADD